DLRLLTEGGDVDEGDLFAVLAVGGSELAIGRHAELRDSRVAAGDVLKLRIAGEVAHEQHSVEAGHGMALSIWRGIGLTILLGRCCIAVPRSVAWGRREIARLNHLARAAGSAAVWLDY